jgi:hypothetical protein
MNQTAFYSFEIDQANIQTNQDFTVSVFVNTDQPVNTASTEILYDNQQISFVNVSFSDSVFPNIVEKKTDTTPLRLTAFTTDHFQQSHGLFARLTFKALQNGNASITLSSNSKIYADDGTGTNVADQTKLPVQLTMNIGQVQQSPVVQQGQTASPVTITTSLLTPTTVQKSETASKPGYSSPGDVLSDKGVRDFSTFSSTPKTYPPASTPPAQGSFPVIYFVLPVILLLTIGIILTIIKFRRKNEIN